jgi:hypothetical protein
MEGIDGRLAAQLGSDVSAEGTAVTHRGVRLGVSDPTVDINDQFDRKSDREQCVGISITAELVFSGRPIQPQPERHRLPRRLRLASVAATSRGSGGPSRQELIPEHNARLGERVRTRWHSTGAQRPLGWTGDAFEREVAGNEDPHL